MRLLPQSIQIYKLNSIFIKVFCFFILLMSLTIVSVGYLSYTNSSKLLVEEVKNANIALLKQAKNSIDRQVEALINISLQISMDARVGKGYYLPNSSDPENLMMYKDIINYLNNIKVTTDGIYNIYVYFFKSNTIASTLGKHDPTFFRNNVAVYSSDHHWPELYNGYLPFMALGRNFVTNNNESASVVSFTRSIPISEAYPYGSLVIDVKEDAFKNSISAAIGNNPTFIYVIDPQGHIITHHKTKAIKNMDEEVLSTIMIYDSDNSEGEYSINKVIDQEEYTMVVTASDINNWSYVSVIPTAYITAKANSIRKITLIFMMISFFVGLILAYILTKMIYEPINKIIKYIQIINKPEANPDTHDELSFINKMLKYVYSENKSLKKSLDESIPKLRGIFISDVLEGNVTPAQFEENRMTLYLEMPYETFQVAVFSIDNLSDYLLHYKEDFDKLIEEQFHLLGKQILSDHVKLHMIKKDHQTIVCLLNISKKYDQSEKILDFFKATISHLYSQYGITSTAGVGRAYNELKDIKGSYMEALFALKFKIVQGQNSMIHIDKVSNIPEHVFEYSLDKEKQIINMVKSGDCWIVKECLQEIIDMNLQKPGIYPEMIHNLFNALAGTGIRTVYEIQSSLDEIFGENYTIYDALHKEDQVDKKKEIIFDVFEKITTYIAKKTQSQNQKVYEQMICFVEENYAGDISLNILGDMIGLSPSYLSWIFKEVSGQNFVDYVNTFRIDKAKELLREEAFTIGMVAIKVGFNTPNHFSRAFKKYEGITPGQFRQII